jgi:hypothetical protein
MVLLSALANQDSSIFWQNDIISYYSGLVTAKSKLDITL